MNATRVNVSLAETPDLELVIEDNGRGIREEESGSSRSLGFLGMRERVQPFGGSIEVKGQEGKGTRVSVSIPLSVQEKVFHA